MVMGLEDVEEVAGIAGDVRGPFAEAAMLVDGANPLDQKIALGSVLLSVLPLYLKDEEFAACETDDVIGTVFVNDAAINVEDFEAKMVVLDPRLDVRIAVEFKRFTRLPPGIEDAQIDMRLHSRSTGPPSKPRLHITGGPNGAFPVKDRHSCRGVIEGKRLP